MQHIFEYAFLKMFYLQSKKIKSIKYIKISIKIPKRNKNMIFSKIYDD